MDLDKAIDNRKSVRSFRNKKVSFKVAIDAIDAAIRAPFAGNHNHLQFIIVENADTISKLAKFARQTWINDSGIVIVVTSDDKQMEKQYDERGRVYAKQQTGAAIENMLLKLTDLGLGSCWVGEFDNDEVKFLLGIPKKNEVEALIPIGYELGKTPKKRKRTLNTTMYWESWDTWSRPSLSSEPGLHDAEVRSK